jgi:3-phosphoglycerate kinase
MRTDMRSLKKLRVLENTTVLVRASLNVPITNGEVANTYRLRRAVPTIQYLQKRHARVILIGHIGEQGTETLAPVAEALGRMVPGLKFCPTTTDRQARDMVRDLPPGGVLMLENLRRHRGEVENSAGFAQELAALADIFVQDSFDVSHRKHASVVGLPHLLPSYAGLLVEEEVMQLTKALKPRRPSLALMGGAKFSTKEPVIAKLLRVYDRVFIGGAIGNDFIKAQGYEVGTSLVSGANVEAIHKLLLHPKLLTPVDAIVARMGASRFDGREVALSRIGAEEAILDNGYGTVEMLAPLIMQAKTILWNGPFGNYEHGFTESTEATAKLIARSRAHSIVGGGDTIAAIEKLGLSNHFSFISTGGGAMLDFLAAGTLPGLEALN